MAKMLYRKETSANTDADSIGINWSKLTTDNASSGGIESSKKRTRRTSNVSSESHAVTTSNGPVARYGGETNPNLMQTNEPYINTYNETQNLLKGTIYQIDVLSNDVKGEMDAIKNSKTIKGKYKYIADLAVTQGSLISAKISAIREMNSVITNAHNLEMKRTKDLKIDSSVDDDKRMMDLYNAFIKTPVGGNQFPQGYSPLGPSIMDITMPSNSEQIMRADVGVSDDAAYQQYLSNMTPEQNRMRLERDPNIKTVVVYNQETGARAFDVIDLRTGQSVPNVAKPDPFLLDNMNINIRTGTARNSDANLDFGLVVVGNRGSINEF